MIVVKIKDLFTTTVGTSLRLCMSVYRLLIGSCLFCVYICVYIHFALVSKDVSSSVFQTPNVSKFEIMVLL